MLMNYSTLFKDNAKVAQVGIIGANGGFGYSFLAQVPRMQDSLSLRVICDLDMDVSRKLLESLKYDSSRFHPRMEHFCHSARSMCWLRLPALLR